MERRGLRGLTFEFSRLRRHDVTGRGRTLCAAPWSGQARHAGAGRLQRGVRHRYYRKEGGRVAYDYPPATHVTRSARTVSNSEAETAMVTVALKLLPTWTANCTFMDVPIWVQSQHRCSTAFGGWPCFGGYGVSGLAVASLFRLTARWPARRGLPVRGLAAAVGFQFFTAVPSKGTAHSAPGRVRVFEPRLGVAIQRRDGFLHGWPARPNE
jgi:hypothetical protein